MLGHRYFWLASKRDVWTTSGWQSGIEESGRDLGQQVEARVRWQVVPESVQVEIGVTQQFGGDYVDRLRGGSEGGDATYSYLQMKVSF